ncbi:MAG: general secretion pathway protein GspB [Candidatus Omnitrophica bacterium]|nr:general secretion pathway protein GspB [Candidatus Omnitrophota bacterium]
MDEKKSTKGISRLGIFGIYILAVLLGIVASKFFFDFITFKKHLSLGKKNIVLKFTRKTNPASAVKSKTFSSLPEHRQSEPISQNNTPAPSLYSRSNTVSANAFVLNGLFYAHEENYALINNKVVKEGDFIDGVKVVKILDDGVRLDVNGSMVFLSYRSGQRK